MYKRQGISGAIKTPRFDVIGNGYIPVGTDSFSLGDPENNLFVGNNIALQTGIESALEGFDLTLRTRPKQLAFVNGFVDFGVYHYDADNVDSFAGGRFRTGMQLINGIQLAAEVNHDERFDTTGALSLVFNFGAHRHGRGSEYAGLARDLEQSARNDHIVRFSQDLIVATNPLTGQAFNVIHANNLQLGVGDGTVESPFATLAEAEAASSADDIIYVNVGDGTDTGYQNGIALQDRQLLFSGGGTQVIQNIDGTLITLSNATTAGATISNAGGNEVVRLANDNIINGINIDATGANFGVLGSGISNATISESSVTGAALDGVRLENVAGNFSVDNTTISASTRDGISLENATGNFDFDSNTILDSMRDGIGLVNATGEFSFDGNTISDNIQDGIGLTNVAGNFNFTNNTITGNMQYGVFVEGSTDPTSVFNFANNVVDMNLFEGIHFDNFQAASIILDSNQTSNNGRNGLEFENTLNPNGTDIVLTNHMADFNGANGATFENGSGSIAVTGGSFTNNSVAGLSLINWQTDGDDTITIDSLPDGTQANFSNNVVGINIELDSGLTQTIDIQDVIVNNNNRGIVASADGVGTELNLSVGGNTTINANANEAIAQLAENGAVINSVIEGAPGAQLTIAGNSADGAAALSFVADGTDPNNRSEINSVVRDVNVTSVGGAALAVNGTGESVVDLLVEDSTLQNIGTAVVVNLNNNLGGEINQTFFDNVNFIGANGFVGNSQAGTLWDLSITNSLIDGSTAIGPSAGTNGIFITTTGGIIPGTMDSDNFTRFNLANTTIQDFIFDGVQVMTFGDAQFLATIDANQILQNGPGLNDDGANDDGILEGPNMLDPTEGFFHDGIDFTASGTSTISLVATNNTFLNNFQRSLDLTTVGSGQIFASVTGNRFSSDVGVDPTMVSLDLVAGDLGVQTMGGQISLSASANTFAAFPAIDVQNTGIAGDVTIGLDGLTNGFNTAVIPGLFTPTAFGLTDALIDAEELSFEMIGFEDVDQ